MGASCYHPIIGHRGEYLLYAMTVARSSESFDRVFRASLDKMERFKVSIPIRPDVTFDVAAQRRAARWFVQVNETAANLAKAKGAFDEALDRYGKAS